ncbi:MAG: DcaP family trimeric outer membrane transporter, partial [Algoriella sp.]
MSKNLTKRICLGLLCGHSFVLAQIKADTIEAIKEPIVISPPAENNDKVDVQFYGFIRNDIFMDTRQMIGAGETLVTLYPKDRYLDVNGADINDASKFHMLSIVSRAGVNLKGPELLGAKTSGILEGEFFGATEGGINEFRLRHAYVMLDWKKTQLGIGQYWHPFVVLEALPNVVNYGTGAPVYALNRNPQVRLTHKFTDKLKVIAALHSQRDFTPNTEPFRNSGMPAAHLQLQYKSQIFTAGIAAQYENLKPKLVSGNPPIKSNEHVENVSFMAYSKLNTKPLQVTVAGYLMQDASSFVQLGGIVGYQETPQSVEVYKPMNTHSMWIDIQQNSKGK